ncbi:hypothetical protein FHX11_000407 [Rhizobium sp. BK602]|nr:hypothetical protein [Rhizobium sp. BK602]
MSLFSEDVNDNHPALMSCDISCASDAIFAPHAHFPDRALEMLHIGFVDILRAGNFDQPSNTQKTSNDILRKGVQLSVNIFVEKLD